MGTRVWWAVIGGSALLSAACATDPGLDEDYVNVLGYLSAEQASTLSASSDCEHCPFDELAVAGATCEGDSPPMVSESGCDGVTRTDITFGTLEAGGGCTGPEADYHIYQYTPASTSGYLRATDINGVGDATMVARTTLQCAGLRGGVGNTSAYDGAGYTGEDCRVHGVRPGTTTVPKLNRIPKTGDPDGLGLGSTFDDDKLILQFDTSPSQTDDHVGNVVLHIYFDGQPRYFYTDPPSGDHDQLFREFFGPGEELHELTDGQGLSNPEAGLKVVGVVRSFNPEQTFVRVDMAPVKHQEPSVLAKAIVPMGAYAGDVNSDANVGEAEVELLQQNLPDYVWVAVNQLELRGDCFGLPEVLFN